MSSPHPNSAILRRLREKQQTQQTRIHVEPTEVFEIPEDKCGLVIGKRGCKIWKILSNARAGVGVNLGDRNSAVDGMIKVYLWGEKEGCDEAKKIIMNLISGPTEVFEIPEDKCGLVIGKYGSKIQKIRYKAGVGVYLGSRDSAVDGMMKVYLWGDKEECDKAKKTIMELISEQTEVFEIPEERIGQVIGEGGSKVEDIKWKTGVRIHVGSSKSAVDGMTKVVLRGTKEGCDKAKKLIMDLISEPTEVFEIPEDKCGLMIGERGCKIQEIRSEAGVGVYLGDRDSAVDGMMKVYIWGDKEECDKAKKTIMELISEQTEVFEIPEERIGQVIGEGGSIVEDIKWKTGVRIHVGSSKSAVDGMTKVVLRGNKEGCDKAKRIIMELISEPIEVFKIPEYMIGVVNGQQGSEIEEILFETGVDVILGSPSRDSAVDGMIKVTLNGNKEGVEEAKNIILDLISMPTEVFEIPVDMIGVVKGRRGSKIQEIQFETGVKVKFGFYDSTFDGMITLWGDKEGCHKAKKIIINLISGSTEVFEIPEDMSGVVIGKGGSKVKEIKLETGVRVIVWSRDSAVDGMIKVTLKGDKEGCDEAKKIIMNLISEPTDVFEIPKGLIGFVIGLRGSKVEEIKSETGARVTFGSRDSAVDGMIKVYLWGDKEACDEAKMIIMVLIYEMVFVSIPLRSSVLLYRLREKQVRETTQQTRLRVKPTEVFEIPEDKCGLMIGKRGFKIRQIRSSAIVGVYLGSRDSAVDGMMKVYLWGGKEGCDKAKKIIMELISIEVFEIPEYMSNWIGNVIGVRGSKFKINLRKIGSKFKIKSETQTGVRVHVGSRKSAFDGMIRVTLRGNKEGCDKAKKITMDLISQEIEVFEIPEDMSGLVIGQQRGSKIKVRVNVGSRNSAVDGMIKVYLCGDKYISKEGCEEAKKIILDLISETTEVFEIPEDMVDVVKGQELSKIQKIQFETGADVNVGSRAVCGMVKVYLRGDKKECADAKNVILDLISYAQHRLDKLEKYYELYGDEYDCNYSGYCYEEF